MSGMSGHVIICGFGRVGELIAKVGGGVPGVAGWKGGSSAGAQVVTAAHTPRSCLPSSQGGSTLPTSPAPLPFPPSCLPQMLSERLIPFVPLARKL